MKTGKLSESILKRSILKKLRTRRPEVIQGAGIGKDCALFSFGEEEVALSVSSFTVFNPKETGWKMIKAINNVAAEKAEPVGILVSMILPKDTDEQTLQELIDGIEDVCNRLGIQIAGGDTRISPFVSRIQLGITLLGRRKEKAAKERTNAGQDIVMTKWLGLAGTSLLVKAREEELKKRLPARLLDEARGFDQYAAVISEAAVAAAHNAGPMHDVSRGGIFTALWELAEEAGVGLDIDIRRIPIRQETIEVTEVLGLNPYELDGTGSLLIITPRGEDLVRKLEENKIPGVVIGSTTAGNARILVNGEEQRYLDRPTGAAPEEEIECEITDQSVWE